MKLPSIGKTRSALYKSGKILGDINAVKKVRSPGVSQLELAAMSHLEY